MPGEVSECAFLPCTKNVPLIHPYCDINSRCRQKLDELVRCRAEFDQEMTKYKSEEANCRKFHELLDELNQEKMARVDELKQINTDINNVSTVWLSKC